MTALSLSFLGILIYAKRPVIFIPARSKPLVANVRSVAQPSTKVVAIDTDVVPMGVAESN
jgi:hypothetical protein